jgi:hypothetical protein
MRAGPGCPFGKQGERPAVPKLAADRLSLLRSSAAVIPTDVERVILLGHPVHQGVSEFSL